MSRSVTCVSAHDSMQRAAAVLAENGVSGAPVVDEQGHCVGVLSATDFMHRFVPGESNGESLSGQHHTLATGDRDEPLHIDAEQDEIVSQYMATAVQSVRADSPLMTASRAMCAEHIHRLPVIDEHGHVAGLISSLDIVAAMINAIEE